MEENPICDIRICSLSLNTVLVVHQSNSSVFNIHSCLPIASKVIVVAWNAIRARTKRTTWLGLVVETGNCQNRLNPRTGKDRGIVVVLLSAVLMSVVHKLGYVGKAEVDCIRHTDKEPSLQKLACVPP